ncbi:MAG: hypothetical protein WKF38_05030 [Candidatus Limnocylindrales bacterium]
MAEVHGRAQPVALDGPSVGAHAHRGEEQATRSQPAGDALEKRALLLAREMSKGIKGDHGIE